MARYYVSIIIGLLICINFVGIFPKINESAELKNIEVDSEPLEEHILEMQDNGGKFYMGYISLRKGVPVYNASFNLSVYPNDNGIYPRDLNIDVGNDFDSEYEFKGVGYGNMGQQQLFSHNLNYSAYSFQEVGNKSTININLPKSGKVKSAEMQFTGELLEWTDANTVATNENYVYSVYPADLDNDGDLDVAVATYYTIVWYNNTQGDGSSWTVHAINSSQLYGCEISVYDIDDDGDNDVVAVSRFGNYGVGQIIYYRNMDGKGRDWDDHIVNSSFSSCYGLRILDMDNDDDGDIVVSSYPSTAVGGVFWYNNTDGNGTTWGNNIICNNLSYTQGFIAADIDDDGDNDTIISSYDNPNIKLHWYENLNGYASLWAPHLIYNKSTSSSDTYVKEITGGDYNSDGDFDIVQYRNTGLYLSIQPSNPKTAWNDYHIDNINPGWYGDLTTADMGFPATPPDGKLDIIACNYNTISWWKNDGTVDGWEKHVITSSSQSLVTLKVANVDNKGYPDIITGALLSGNANQIKWYDLNGSFLTDLELDIGGDSSNEWTYSAGNFDTTIKLDNLVNTFQSLIDSRSVVMEDIYGNEFVKIQLKLTSGSGGKITFHDMNIEYDYTVKVAGTESWSLADELNEHISDSDVSNDTIPIAVNVKSGGRLKIDNISVIYNEYPKVNKIEGYSIDEDTRNDYVINLSHHFTDDYSNSTALNYSVVSFTNEEFVNVYINDDQTFYLGVDAETGDENDNWFGETRVTVKAADEYGHETYSLPITIKINPVNDEPELGPKEIPNLSINEGTTNKAIDLDAEEFFLDIDSSELYFNCTIDPLSEYDGEQLNITIDNWTRRLSIEALGDWYTPQGVNVRLRIFCDDDDIEVNKSSVYQDFFIIVNNLNDDAPTWKYIDPVYRNEDEPKKIEFNIIADNYVSDIDNPKEELIFTVVNVSSEQVYAEIDSQMNVHIWSDENYFGTAQVTLSATDGANTANQTFQVIIEPMNDRPEVELLSPGHGASFYNSSVLLKWNATDIDPGDEINLTYTIYLDTVSGSEVYLTNYSNTSIILTGLQDKSTYYWKVIPNDGKEDGICITDPLPLKFSIEFVTAPYSVLKLPADGAVTNRDYLFLMWDGYGEAGYKTTYNVYLSKEPLELPYPGSALIASDLMETKLMVENLEPYTTYYWTVIPSNLRSVGTCQSGILSFTYDPSKAGYQLDLDIPYEIKVEYGKPEKVAIKIINTGDSPDIVVLSFSSGMQKSYFDIEGAGLEHYIGVDDTLVFILNISADVIPLGDYTVNLSIESKGIGDVVRKTIPLIIVEKQEEEESRDLTQIYYTTIPIVIVILLVAVFLFWRKRAIDNKRRVEAELLKPISKSKILTASDVEYYLKRFDKDGKQIIDTKEELPRLPPSKDAVEEKDEGEKEAEDEEEDIEPKEPGDEKEEPDELPTEEAIDERREAGAEGEDAEPPEDEEEEKEEEEGTPSEEAEGERREAVPEGVEVIVPEAVAIKKRPIPRRLRIEREYILERNERIMDQIAKMGKMKDEGLLTNSEFKKKKKELLKMYDSSIE